MIIALLILRVLLIFDFMTKLAFFLKAITPSPNSAGRKDNLEDVIKNIGAILLLLIVLGVPMFLIFLGVKDYGKPLDDAPEVELTISQKEIVQSGMNCRGALMVTFGAECDSEESYYVNGYKTSSSLYATLQEEHTYRCQLLFDELYYCKEEECEK